MAIVILLMIFIFLTLGIVLWAFFCTSYMKTMKCIPEEKRTMPAWLVWLIFVPVAGYVFMWMTIAFSLPNSCKAYLKSLQQPIAKAKSLQTWGILFAILPIATYALTLIFQSAGLIAAAAAGSQAAANDSSILALLFILAGYTLSIVAYITYWVKMVGIRRALNNNA